MTFNSTERVSSMITADTDRNAGRPRDGLYEPVLADSEREAVGDLLQYLENVSTSLDIVKSVRLIARSAERPTSFLASRFEH